MAGCFLMPGSPRPDPKAVAGPAPYVEDCVTCHAATVTHYAGSRHAARGVRCGQCHTPGGHPEFSEPVRDSKCGGCHQAQYQQTLASRHFARRLERPLDGDRAARASLRRDGFTAPSVTGRSFVGDSLRADGRSPVRDVPLRRPSPRSRPRPARYLLRQLPRKSRGAFRGYGGRRAESMLHMPRSSRDDRRGSGREHASVRRAGRCGRRAMSARQQFDGDVAGAMTRRAFLVNLTRASAAAVLASSATACGTVQGSVERPASGEGDASLISPPPSARSWPRSSMASIRRTPRSAGGSSGKIPATTPWLCSRSMPGRPATSTSTR